MQRKDILEIHDLAAFEKIINRDGRPCDMNTMLLPGVLHDKQKTLDGRKDEQPCRMQFNMVYLILGDAFKPGSIVIVPENTLYHSGNICSSAGYYINFKTEFIQPLLNGTLSELFPFFDLETQHIISITNGENELIQQAFKDIIAEYQRFSHERDFLLRNYLHILLLRIRDIYRPHHKNTGHTSGRSAHIAHHFKVMIEKNFKKIRKVDHYAGLLNITPKHLTEAVKETFSKTPRQMIADILLLEAKIQLGSTMKTVSEIAHLLNFDDQSHFSHFIRQRTGFTPLQLRRNKG